MCSSTNFERVIDDVVDSFSPCMRMSSIFNDKFVINRVTLQFSMAAEIIYY